MFYQRVRFPGHKIVVASCTKDDIAVRFGNRTAIDIIEHFRGNDGPKVVLDIGGNVGTTAVILGIALKNVKIHVAEPHPKCFEALLENIGRNKLEGIVIPHNIAIGSNLNFISYAQSKIRKNSGISITCESGSLDTHFKVKSLSLDDFISKTGMVDVLKLDVEGSEYKIFSEFTSWNMVKSYHVEFHDISGIDRVKVESDIRSKIAKYSMFVKEIPKTAMGRIL